MTRLKTSPSFLKGLKTSLTTTYGITDESVFSKRSFLGFKFGERPTVRIENVTRVYPSGGLFGDVHFGEGSHTPVVWKNVFRPGSKAKEAEAIIERLLEARKPPPPPWHEGLELEDYEVVFPRLPNPIYDALYFGKGIDYHVRGKKASEGDWVRKGDVIFTLSHYPDEHRLARYGTRPGVVVRTVTPVFKRNSSNSTLVVSPCDGVITRGIEPHDNISKKWGETPGDYGEPLKFYEDDSCNCFYSIRPVRGTVFTGNPYSISLRGVVEWCESFVSDEDRLQEACEYSSAGYISEPDTFRNLLMQAVGHVKHHIALKRKINNSEQDDADQPAAAVDSKLE